MRYLSHSDYLLDLPYSFDWEHDKEFIIVGVSGTICGKSFCKIIVLIITL
jgi:hypothetical protein